jgi:hypothetical protein
MKRPPVWNLDNRDLLFIPEIVRNKFVIWNLVIEIFAISLLGGI